ncbi:lambda exonuclease family protein [Ruixingdingia sedimenti]|uniref:YqaJ viral recombinase family protein n=1 Tax=Ruixingdingia sedimenti TaxID=3073604 RepID=A0ABU1FD20_9RHOB|nr:YqaJ viral recombinase family protein [Xinfangfangia sp. LG-4]MDR5654478.1 YqaJ viral recombinase family protein [Xinfangfangia sp. LG-4]
MFDFTHLPTITLPNGALAFQGLEQGTHEWLQVRAGVATASRFKDVLTQPQSKADKDAGKPSKTSLTYAYELAGEILTGEPAEGFSTVHTRRGQELEPQLRADYEMLADTDVQQVGFVKRDRFGASPDGLVGSDGLVEFKTHLPKLLIPMLLDGEFPEEHKAQTQGQLWVTGRQWVDLCAYYPGLPLFKVRAYRDEEFIAVLEQRLAAFDALVSDTVARIQAYGQPVA